MATRRGPAIVDEVRTFVLSMVGEHFIGIPIERHACFAYLIRCT